MSCVPAAAVAGPVPRSARHRCSGWLVPSAPSLRRGGRGCRGRRGDGVVPSGRRPGWSRPVTLGRDPLKIHRDVTGFRPWLAAGTERVTGSSPECEPGDLWRFPSTRRPSSFGFRVGGASDIEDVARHPLTSMTSFGSRRRRAPRRADDRVRRIMRLTSGARSPSKTLTPPAEFVFRRREQDRRPSSAPTPLSARSRMTSGGDARRRRQSAFSGWVPREPRDGHRRSIGTPRFLGSGLFGIRSSGAGRWRPPGPWP